MVDATGTAIMADYTTAGQFKIVNGQLVELVDTKGTLLYANVGQPASASSTTLPVTFSKAQNTYGIFAFQGGYLSNSDPPRASTLTREECSRRCRDVVRGRDPKTQYSSLVCLYGPTALCQLGSV